MRLTSNHWKLCLLLFPIIGTCVLASPGGQRGFFQAWWGTQGFDDPTLIDGLEWWIDAADATSISLQAGTNLVSQWNDKSGNGKHLTQGASASRPAWIENERNGNAVIRFDGLNDFMSVPSSTALFRFIHESNTTWFAVAKFGTNQYPGVSYHLIDNTGFAQGRGISFAYRNSSLGNTNIFQMRINAGNAAYIIQNQPTDSGVAGEYVSIAHIANLTASTLDRSIMRVNNELHQQNTGTASISTGNSFQNLTLGNNSANSPPSWLLGEVCEIIIYSGILSDADIGRVRNYLNNKWGIVY